MLECMFSWVVLCFFFKRKTAYEMRISDWSSDVCSSDLHGSLQLLAEVGKWLQKEDLVPERADARLFKMAPYIVLASTFLIVVVMPFGPDAYFTKDRKSVVLGTSVSVRVDIGGRRILKNTTT